MNIIYHVHTPHIQLHVAIYDNNINECRTLLLIYAKTKPAKYKYCNPM